MADSDYEHWPENRAYLEETPKQQVGYDPHNGLRSFTYQQPPPPKPESVKTEVIYVEQPKPKPERKIRYVYVLPKEHPAPPPPKAETAAESGKITHFDQQPEPSLKQPEPQPKTASHASRVTYCYSSASPTKSGRKSTYYTYGQAPAEQPPKRTTYQYIPSGQGTASKNDHLPWIGRSKAQVDDDNMKMAFNEGAGKERKVAPIDTKEDEVFWVVEVDGSQTLRSPEAINGVKGSWREDPRFKSWYFVREE